MICNRCIVDITGSAEPLMSFYEGVELHLAMYSGGRKFLDTWRICDVILR